MDDEEDSPNMGKCADCGAVTSFKLSFGGIVYIFLCQKCYKERNVM